MDEGQDAENRKWEGGLDQITYKMQFQRVPQPAYNPLCYNNKRG